MLGLTFSSKLDLGCYIIFVTKTASKRTGTFIGSMKFLSPQVVLYVYKSTIHPCMEYCCHVWTGASSCYLEFFEQATKTNMQDCWPFTCCFSWALGSSSKCGQRASSVLAQPVPLPFSWGRHTCYSDRLHYFSVTIPRCYKDVYVNSFFPHTARLWNSLPIECFPLTYNLNGFKSRINRHLLTVGSL